MMRAIASCGILVGFSACIGVDIPAALKAEVAHRVEGEWSFRTTNPRILSRQTGSVEVSGFRDAREFGAWTSLCHRYLSLGGVEKSYVESALSGHAVTLDKFKEVSGAWLKKRSARFQVPDEVRHVIRDFVDRSEGHGKGIVRIVTDPYDDGFYHVEADVSFTDEVWSDSERTILGSEHTMQFTMRGRIPTVPLFYALARPLEGFKLLLRQGKGEVDIGLMVTFQVPGEDRLGIAWEGVVAYDGVSIMDIAVYR